MSVVKSVNDVPLIRLGRGGGLALVDVKAGDRNIHDKQTNQSAGSAFNYGFKSSKVLFHAPFFKILKYSLVFIYNFFCVGGG